MIPQETAEFDLLAPTRLPMIIYLLLVNKLTTRSELRDLTIEEVLDLYETCLISNYNKSVVMKGGKQNG